MLERPVGLQQEVDHLQHDGAAHGVITGACNSKKTF